MRQTTKKIFTFLLALCMILGLLPAYTYAASAAEEDALITQSMTLGADLTLHLWGKLPEAYEEHASEITATLTYSDTVETKNLSDLEKNESGYYHLPVEMAVAEMSENINLVMKCGSVEILNRNYSVRDYLKALLEGNYSQQTKDLCLELLNFGARAQEYFGHDLDDLADAGLNITAANTVPVESPAVNATGAVEGVSAHSISVRFLSKTAVRFYFNVDADVNSYTFTIGGTECTPVAKDGMYYIETPGIDPQNMSDVITVSVTDGTDVLSLQYAPIWFFIRVHNKTEEAVTKNLMEAAYSYYKEAEDYTVGPPVEIETTEPETTEPETTEPEVTEPETTEPEVTDPSTYLSMDVLFTTLGGSTDPVELRFYPYNFEGSVHNNFTDKVTVTAGTTATIKLDLNKYLVDGELTGIGFAIFGGPAWDAKLPDGSTPDRHTVTISNVHLGGEQSKAFDLSQSTWASAANAGYTDANGSGVAAIGSTIVISNGFCYDAHKISLVEDTSTYLSMDLLLTTLGNSTDPVEIRLYNYNYEGSVGDGYTDQISVTAGTTAAIKVKVDQYLVDGELPGFGVAIFGGPEWNTQLTDGTYDRHSVVISNVRLEGAENRSISLNGAAIAAGTNGTGFTWANSGGMASIVGGEFVITGGYRYDAYEITFGEDTEPETTEPETTEPEVTEPSTYLSLDMQIDTLGGDWANDIEIRFYPYSFEGNPHEVYADSVIFKAGEKQTVKLDAEKYLVDGQLTGIGIGIFGGPQWDAKLPDGYTPDRHTVTISSVKLEGDQSKVYDLSQSTCASGTNGTGYTTANGSGVGAFVNGVYQISNGFCYDAHKISLVEDTSTYLSMDLLLTTLGNSTDPVEIRLYNYNYEGSVGDGYTDQISVTAGTTAAIKVKVDQYLVDGELPGFGVAIFGGPEWNTQLTDGTYDRHSVVISDVRLEGAENRSISLNGAAIAAGTNGTGFTWANSGGMASIVGGEFVITGGYRYDAYEITFGEDTEPETTEPEVTEPETTEPEVTDPSTYLSMDVLFTTLGGSTDPVEIGFYPNNFEGDINNWTDKITVTAGTTANIKLDLNKYLVDGGLPGIGFAIFGGPAWDAKLPDGYTPDRHTVTISNVHLGGEQSKAFDLSQSAWTKAADAGYTNANGSGEAAIGSTIVITNGFQYDGHKITLVEDTSTYLCMDLEFTTLSNSTDPVNIRLYNYNYAGSVGDGYTDLVSVTAGTTTNIKVKVDNYLVDGALPGFGVAIFGGPEWNTPLDGGGYDRHSVVISNVRLEGVEARSIDLSGATVAAGTNGTGFTWANSGGTAAIVDGQLVITNGYMYDAYEITF